MSTLSELASQMVQAPARARLRLTPTASARESGLIGLYVALAMREREIPRSIEPQSIVHLARDRQQALIRARMIRARELGLVPEGARYGGS